MYEKEQKESFIEDYMHSRVIAKTSLYSLFKKTSKFEYELNKDCSEFTKEEILNMYSSFGAKSINVVLNYNIILKAYARYVNYGKTKEVYGGAYDEIYKKDIEDNVTISESLILTRQEVDEIEDELYNYTDKAIIECLWEGISGKSMKDLVSIEYSTIDHKNKILHLEDKTIALTNKLYNFLIKAFQETQYTSYGKKYTLIEVEGEGKLYKERWNSHSADDGDKYFRWVYRKIRIFRNHVGIPQLTMKNIHTSGIIHYLREGMKENDLDLRSYLKSYEGKAFAVKYGYESEFYVENCYRRFIKLI